MTNSREKFEAWFEKQFGCAPMRDTIDDEVYIGWLAGRESMRDEACESALDTFKAPYSKHIAESIARKIKEIQP